MAGNLRSFEFFYIELIFTKEESALQRDLGG
jgi:hypothetical protein